MSGRRFPVWTLIGVVLVVALIAGSGVLSSTPPTAAERSASIESVIRCPSCEDLSVATSSAPTAVAVRATVRQLVGDGRTDAQVEQYLEARYGSTIVLDPPASGWSLLVWVLPVACGLLAAVALTVVLVRRRRIGDGDDPVAVDLDPGLVEERRAFIARSLADADAEFLAGDLSDRDYLLLRRRDMRRLAALDGAAPTTAVGSAAGVVASSAPSGAAVAVAERPEPANAPEEPPVTPPRTRSRRSWWFLAGAVACFAGALAVAVVLFSSSRLPGQTATGSIALNSAQQTERTLDQAATLENEGQVGEAAQLYQSVLTAHPKNVVALAQMGWLEYQTGTQGASASLLADARSLLERAVALGPGDYAAHLYLGTVLLDEDGNAAGAVDQYRDFLADDPPHTVVAEAAAELRVAYGRAGVALPPQVPAA